MFELLWVCSIQESEASPSPINSLSFSHWFDVMMLVDQKSITDAIPESLEAGVLVLLVQPCKMINLSL